MGEVFFWGSSAEPIVGYSKEEIIGKDLHMFMIQYMRLYKAYREVFKKFCLTGKESVAGMTVERKVILPGSL
ncbi:hypothetical protein [Caldanaerobacter sp.]|uniref:hypothetical protein n=1 Tax=Caldanaerobacter sp. TaxID=2930036 RepID=UPI003C758851